MSLANVALSGARAISSGAPKTVASIVDFVEEPWGLNMRLFPVQRVILKAHYGLELDDKDTFSVSDWQRAKSNQFTEKQYLEYCFNEGRSNIKEVVPGEDRREMILSIGRRSGKCVTGDTLVLTDRGIYPIVELGDPGGSEVQPLVVGVAQEGSAASQSAYFYNGGVKPTYRIMSYAGVSVEGTGNHRVRVMTPEGVVGWARLDELRSGDVLAVHRTSNLWASKLVDVRPYHVPPVRRGASIQPDTFDERWGLLMGYLVGDGSWTCQTGLSVTVEHPETRAEIEGLFTDLCKKSTFSPDKRTARTGAVRVFDTALRAFMHGLGFNWGCEAHTKRTPWVVLRSPRTVVRAYLQGLFEADGTVTSGGKTVSFCSASRDLARETQVLLLNFGVVSSLRVKHNRKLNRDYYVVAVRGLRSRRTFATEIGFRSRKKQDPLEAGLVAPAREGGDTESVPHQRAWVERLVASVPKQRSGGRWQRSTLRAVLGNVCKPGRSTLRAVLGHVCKPGSQEDLTYSRIRALLPVAESLGADPVVLRHFRDLLRTDYFFDPVVSVTPGEARVYDLNVPDGESFVANGLTNHNTTVSACIAAYETYKLISKGDPQAYYGLPQSNMIQLISIATDKDQAGLLYQEVSGHFRACAFFNPYTANNTMSYARFQTPKDVEQYGSFSDDPSAKATIKVTFRSCIAKGLRGAGNIVVILDEVAHFTDAGQSSADEVYNAVVPSTSAYSPKDPTDRRVPIGSVEGRVILISSPLGRQGLFYKMFQMGMGGGRVSNNMLCIQAPTWEVNPTIPASEFEKQYLKDPAVFFTEYGGEFSDRTRGWIERGEDLDACVDKALRPQARGIPRRAYFMGLDLGLVGDGTAISIGHLNDTGKIVVDLVDQIKAGEGKHADRERLDFDDVADWIKDLSERFYLQEGVFDQWAGIPLEQALAKRGLSQMKAMQMTKNVTSQMFQNFKDMMWDKRLSLYDFPIAPNEDHCSYIRELLELQAHYQTKYITTVEAPNIEGKHDDRADALVRMVWLASNKLAKQLTFSRPGQRAGGPPPGYPIAATRAKLLRSGSHESRMIPRGSRGRGTPRIR